MAITFAVRGDSLDARYAAEGKTPGLTGLGSNQPQLVADATSIDGVKSISLKENALVTVRAMNFPGRTNTPSDRPRSMLWRFKPAGFTHTIGLGFMGTSHKNWFNLLGLCYTAAKTYKWSASNEYGPSSLGTSAAQTMATTTWHDVVLTWTGTSSANGIEIWHDGVRVLQDTCGRFLPTPFGDNDRLAVSNICIGEEDRNSGAYSSFNLDEFVIWDEVIDPTSILLTSGTGSLNGASRTAFVDVDAYDGAASSGGGSSSINMSGIGA